MRTLALLSLLPALYAQEFRATISGEVTDPSGAPVPAARVTATSLERNLPYASITNAAGRYTIPFLLPGAYRVIAEKPGFKKLMRQSISLQASDKLALDFQLDLGPLADTVTVSAAVPLLQTESATRQAVIENRVLENVPAGGRDLYALQYDEPGVVKASTYWGSMELYAFGNVNAVTIAGGRISENETVLDGVTNTKSDRGVAFVPAITATREFTVQTNSYDAQFGRVGGGVTLINLKSGTNRPHGQLFEYFKNDLLRANDWVANKDGDPRTPFKNNTFGFELDGPAYIPKIFDGRNKVFFMISLEGLREHDPGGQLRTLPLPEQLKGDFSHLLNGAGTLVTIYDPLSTILGPDGKTYVRTPFPGNILPANRINPVSAKVASFYPAANLAGDGPSHQNNYAKVLPATNSYDSWLGKMDYMVTQKSRLSFRYGQTPWLNFAKLVWGDNPAEPSNQYPSTRVARNWGADWTYILTPSMVLNLRGGLARYEAFSGNRFGVNYDPRQLGFPSSLVSQFTALEFPRFNIGNYSEIGSSGVFSYLTQDVWSIEPNLSWTHGRHVVRFGSEFRRYNDNNLNPGQASGLYNFDASWTQANPQRADAASGNEFASFLLGYPSGGYVDHNIDPAYRSNYYALFVQDDFKLSPRLTLNLGLRWDYESPRVERYNRMVRGFDHGLLFAGSSGDARLAFHPYRRDFQPRAGVAWHVAQRLVFRGGYGLSYLGQNSNGPAAGFSRQTPLVSTLDQGLTPAVTLSDPFPSSIYPSGLLQPIGATQGLATNLGQNVSFQDLNRPLPYSHQYSAGFQYQLPGGWLADASYVGNLTRRLPVTLALNFIPADVLNSIPVDQRQSYFNQQVPNPMAGLLPNSALNGPTVARQQLLFAYPQYGSGLQMTDVPIGRQRYDSAQFKLTRRFSRGLAVTAAYTISKTLEQVAPLNPQDGEKLEKRLAQFDVPRQFSIVGTYDLPWHWTFSGVFMSHSGFPLPFPNAAPLAAKSAKLTDAQRDAAARQAGRAHYDPSYDVWFDTSLFPTTAQAPFTLRTFPTRFPDVRGKPLNVADISLYHEFKIKEGLKLQVRCDAHNAANFPWFASLDSSGNNVTRPLFGHLNANIGNETRVVVGVLKLIF